jgi:hypothetical protein
VACVCDIKIGPRIVGPGGEAAKTALFFEIAMALLQISPANRFKIVCEICDAVGIAFDLREDAPSSTLIKCGQCGAPRGTLGDLRYLSSLDQRDLFDV